MENGSYTKGLTEHNFSSKSRPNKARRQRGCIKGCQEDTSSSTHGQQAFPFDWFLAKFNQRRMREERVTLAGYPPTVWLPATP